MSTTAVIENVDPRVLLIDDNLRATTEVDKDLVASIKKIGVLEPIVAVRTADGGLRVWFGHRRTLGAIEAGRATVPVVITGEEGTDAATRAEVRFGQWDENERRAPLTTADKTKAVQDLLDLGVTITKIRTRTRLSRPDVDAAAKVAGSKLATAAVSRYEFLTLDQAGTLAEFEADQEALALLVAAAKESEGRFQHVAQRLRDAAEVKAAEAATRASLEAAGVIVSDERPTSSQQHLRRLFTADGEQFTEEGHRECPGHRAYLERDWVRVQSADDAQGSASPEDNDGAEEAGDDTEAEDTDSHYEMAWVPVYYCTDPAGYGHISPDRAAQDGETGSPDEAADAEHKRAERALVVRNNRDWRSAETVRRAWLREFLSRNKLPPGGLRYILGALGRGDRDVARAMENGHELAAQLLGVSRPTPEAWREYGVAEALDAASDARAQVIALGLVLAAHEVETDVHTWRREDAADRRYFQALAGWGYGLSDVERIALGDADEGSTDEGSTDEG